MSLKLSSENFESPSMKNTGDSSWNKDFRQLKVSTHQKFPQMLSVRSKSSLTVSILRFCPPSLPFNPSHSINLCSRSDQFQDYNYICPSKGNMVKTRSKVLKEEQWEKEYLFARPSDEEIQELKQNFVSTKPATVKRRTKLRSLLTRKAVTPATVKKIYEMHFNL